MPNLRELLSRAAPEPSDDWDVADVARRGRGLRRRRRAAAGITGVGALIALAVAVPAVLDRPDTEVRMDPGDGAVQQESATAEGYATATPAIAGHGEVIWPFAALETIVIAGDDVDADALAGLADEIAGLEGVAEVTVLDPDAVIERIGEVQAARLSAGGAVVAVLDAASDQRERHEAAGEITRLLIDEDGPDERVATFVQPECHALAESAALTGVDAATELLEAAECGQQVHVIAADPDAAEPWVVTSTDRSAPPPGPPPEEPLPPGEEPPGPTGSPDPPDMILEGGVEEPGDEPWELEEEAGEADVPKSIPPPPEDGPVPYAERPPLPPRQCVDIATVRVRPAQGCGGDADAIAGVTGTRWDRDTAVLAGIAPEGTAEVWLDDEAAEMATDVGDLPIFASSLALTGSPVTVRALDDDGTVLDEREVTPADFAVDPHGFAEQRMGPEIEAGWPFTAVSQAMVVVAPPGPHAGDRGADELRDELAAVDGVVDVEAADGDAIRRIFGGRAPEDADEHPLPSGLVVTTQERDAAMALGTLVERHDVMAVHTPTCANLAGSAMVHGVGHAEALLDEVGCDGLVLVGADPGADEPWVAAASVEDGHVCTASRSGRGGGSSCGPAPSAGRLELSSSGGVQRQRLLTGLVSRPAETVEITTDEGTRTIDVVVVDEPIRAFAAVLPGGDVRVRALDADGDVVAEDEMSDPPGQAPD